MNHNDDTLEMLAQTKKWLKETKKWRVATQTKYEYTEADDAPVSVSITKHLFFIYNPRSQSVMRLTSVGHVENSYLLDAMDLNDALLFYSLPRVAGDNWNDLHKKMTFDHWKSNAFAGVYENNLPKNVQQILDQHRTHDFFEKDIMLEREEILRTTAGIEEQCKVKKV